MSYTKIILTEEHYAEHARLKAWIEENGYTYHTLGHATGDIYNNISRMLRGDRRISESFKWRFLLAFGYEEAAKIFGTDRELA